MIRKKIGQRVKILDGLKEFIGKTGTIVDWEHYGGNEPPYYRVRLDELVEVPGVGMVRDDLWQGRYLRNIGR